MLVRCQKCGWIHVGYSLGSAEECIREFNSIYVQLTVEQKEEFYQSTPARLKDYQACHRCKSSYQQMEVVDPKDPKVTSKFRGQTLKAVLLPNE
jgi:hypothetical protein